MVKAYGITAPKTPLGPLEIARRTPGPHDVQIEIAYCGVCHTDVSFVQSAAGTFMPMVPGHEIVGHVSAVGSEVKRYKVGDLAGIAGIIDSCHHCADCDEGLENYCDNHVGTYNSPSADAPGHTLGGYSQSIVANERHVVRIRHPKHQLAAVAPLLCAGVTTYAPLKQWKVGPGSKVGIIGLGGLGHVGVKLARAMGAYVVAFTTSEFKREELLKLGAEEVVVTTSRDDEMAPHAKTLDLIISTVAVPFDFNPYIKTLKRDGVMHLVGGTTAGKPIDQSHMVGRRRGLSGSLAGSVPEIQETLDFCATHGILADIELIRMDQINEAYDRMLKSDVKYRFVIDNATLAA